MNNSQIHDTTINKYYKLKVETMKLFYIVLLIGMVSVADARRDANATTKVCAFHDIVYHQFNNINGVPESQLMCPMASQEFINSVSFPKIHNVHDEECYSWWWTQ